MANLLEHYKALGCRGYGELTARLRWYHPAMRALLGACQRVGFPLTFHTITPSVNSYGVIDDIGLPGLTATLERFPELVMIGHSPGFWSEISGDVDSTVKDGYPSSPVAAGGVIIGLFRAFPGLHADLSAGSGFNALGRDPEFAYEFLDEFQDRLMMGLDHTDVSHDFQHIEWLKAAQAEGHISGEACEKILWKNADRLIGLGLMD